MRGNVFKIEAMIDLKALEQEIDALLDSKSDKDLLDWLDDYNNKNLESFVGVGKFYDIEADPTDFNIKASSRSVYCINPDNTAETNFEDFSLAA